VGSLGTSWVSRLDRVKWGMAFDTLHRSNTRAIDIYLQMNMFLLHKVCSDLPLRDERHKKSDLCHKSSLVGGNHGWYTQTNIYITIYVTCMMFTIIVYASSKNYFHNQVQT
jgi:hypothetical protein